MANPIDFYFDFSSPYGYLASTRIDALAARHGRVVRWRPFLIGALYKQLGYMPLEQPGKRAYFLHDVPRSARAMGVALTIPASFPEALIAPARAVYWIADRDVRRDPIPGVGISQAGFFRHDAGCVSSRAVRLARCNDLPRGDACRS